MVEHLMYEGMFGLSSKEVPSELLEQLEEELEFPYMFEVSEFL